MKKTEFTQKEIDFVVQCVYMSSREGFYLIDDGVDVDNVGMSVLNKLGLDKEVAEEYMKGY